MSYEWKPFGIDISHWFRVPVASMYHDLPLHERINKRAQELRVREWLLRQPNIVMVPTPEARGRA